MDLDKALDELKQGFGLKDKQVQIIKALERWPLTAEQLSKQTKIPLGRIYTYLNELVDLKLLEKTTKKPHFYEIKDIHRSLANFIKHRSDQLVHSRARVLELLKEQGTESQVELIDSREKYSLLHLDMIAESKFTKVVPPHGSFPLALYPLKWEDFLATRTMVKKSRPTIAFTDYSAVYLSFKTYRDAFEEKKMISVLIERSTWENMLDMLDQEFGKAFVKTYLEDLKDRIAKATIEVFVTDEYQPIEIDINEYRVGLAIRHEQVVTGLIIQGKSATEVFSTVFEQSVARSVPLKRFLDQASQTTITAKSRNR